ncbi:MAG TPA: hypothetical protein VFR10_11210 [bacterium]|nr:hypothetical protein [bacterium]
MNDAQGDALVHAVVRDWKTALLASPDRALCGVAEKLTQEPTGIRPRDLDVLREQGFDDRAIHDAVQIIGYFNLITRVAEALGVEPETFIRSWGE